MVELVIREVLEVTGRGTMFIISLAENKLIYYKKLVGQLIEYEGVVYRITDIETALLLTHPPRPQDMIGLIVSQEVPSNDRYKDKFLW